MLLVNTCYFAYKGINEPQWTEIILGKDYMKYANECLYKNSPGNLVNLMDKSQQTSFNKAKELIDGIDIDLSVIVMTEDGVPGLKTFKNDLFDKYQSYELSDFTKTTAADRPSTVISSGNDVVSCTKDEW